MQEQPTSNITKLYLKFFLISTNSYTFPVQQRRGIKFASEYPRISYSVSDVTYISTINTIK